MPARSPSAALVVREHHGQAYFEAKFRHEGRQIKRRIGPAWLDRDPATGAWRPRRGRVPEGSYDQRRAHVAAAELVADFEAKDADRERAERECLARGVTFREVAREYLRWLADVRGAKPATLLSHRSVLAEPGTPYKRGKGVIRGQVMAPSATVRPPRSRPAM